MKRGLGFAFQFFIALGLIHAFIPRLEAQNRNQLSTNQPRDGACFYMDVDYRGETFCLDAGRSLQNVEGRYNDRISSIRVFGRAQVIVYQDDNFGGARRTFDRDASSLGDWNDKITSIQVSGVQYGSGSSGYEPRDGACFYMDVDYRGETFCLDAGRSLQNVEGRYNDRISSIRVFGRVQVIVYQDDNFGGARRTFDRDASSLGDWNDKITSIEVR
jgi:hypothetical protein